MVDQVIQFKKNYFLCIIVLQTLNHVASQQMKLTGSSDYAVLGEAFTWTCEIVPPVKTTAVFFYRNTALCGGIRTLNNACDLTKDQNPRYILSCLSELRYTLTIPVENMTEFEQNSSWKCGHPTEVSLESNDVVLTIAIEVHNITLIPSNNTMKIIEGTAIPVTCVVNRNASPAPNITWFLGSIDITSRAGSDASTIIITGNRTDNTKMLQCKASNNIKQPRMANTTLLVEYPPTVETFSPLEILEGENISLTCMIIRGNPNDTTIVWTKLDKPEFRQNGATLQLRNIKRTGSGIYRCTAENNFSNGKKGSDSQNVVVNVLYPPIVETFIQQDILEGENLTITSHVTLGNPNDTTIVWTKLDKPEFRQNGAILQLYNIKRTGSGTYICTAENNFSNGKKGTDSQSVVVNVLYPPVVKSLSSVQDIVEGRNLSVACQVIPGNPNLTYVYWNKEGEPRFQQNGTILRFFFIQRINSGTYYCNAENNYNNKGTGKHNQSTIINVLYQPTIENKPVHIVNESVTVALTRTIDSNPWSDVSWQNGTDVLTTETSVNTTTLTIEKAMCTDTRNFTLVASNGVQNNATTLVELRVNCKPRSYKTNFTLGVTDTTGIDFSTFVIAYPEPSIKLEYENGTESDQIMKNINRNAVNNFTIKINQAVVNQSDFGVYHLKVWNSYGELTVVINVIPQRKPNVPVSIEIVCEETRAKVQWKSSFNGGDPQIFTVIASSGQQSRNISDKGENFIHSTFVQHLQPSTMYVFYVSAQNSHGIISSEKISCTTLAESGDELPIIFGSAAGGGFTLVVILVVVVFLFRRYTNTEKQAGKSQRFENDLVENENVDDDGLKDNILYVSADPRENEKHEAAVYAAVNKSDQMSNNNSNVYAEVKKNGLKGVKEGAIYSDVKPKKGFFKKDGKIKKEKRQKKTQEVADVYENSDDIAMTANPDNVYSNTNHNNDSAKEQRGYKNKDGLLYVEVQFDTKTEERNPVIHGDDEKTDYATVEFPVPSSLHDRE